MGVKTDPLLQNSFVMGHCLIQIVVAANLNGTIFGPSRTTSNDFLTYITYVISTTLYYEITCLERWQHIGGSCYFEPVPTSHKVFVICSCYLVYT